MSIVSLIITLVENVALLVAGAFVLLIIFPQKELESRGKETKGLFMLILFFGLFGILGTYKGNAIFHSVANLRAMAVIPAGLFGGPLVGFGAGLIAGGHRFLMDPWGFSSLPCSLATISEGLIAGMVHRYYPEKSSDWKTGMFLACGGEIMHMGLVLLLSRPFSEAVALVRLIALPMIIANTLGTGLFLHMINMIVAFRERVESIQAEKVFDIASKTVGYLRDGLNVKSANATAEIIFNSLPVASVAITDPTTILAFKGLGEDHHKAGESVLGKITQTVIETGQPSFLTKKQEIGCNNIFCPLTSAIVAPLRKGSEIIGTLIFYGSKEFKLNVTFFAIAKGLAELLSIQLELEDIQIKNRLLADAKIRHLQAQINPHFLFNSLNTIASFCRTNPDKARELILELSVYMRRNLDSSKGFIPLEEELNQITSYLAIEQARFGDKIKALLDIEKGCSHYPIPSLIIQPIVENAVKHGIKPKEGSGTVKIKIYKDSSHLQIVVQDDGIGMSKEKLALLLDRMNSDLEYHSTGVGLRNSHCRLKQIYGTEYGLKIQSEAGKGTTVSFSIPLPNAVQKT